jgi:uncharacterized protein (TIGR02996 family)
MSDEAAFLAALKANPADDTTRLVYADWLDENGEPEKAAYLRTIVDSARTDPRAIERAVSLGGNLPSDWRLATAARFALVLESFEPTAKIQAIKAVREMTGMGLGEAAGFVELAPSRFLFRTTAEGADGLVCYFTHGRLRVESDLADATSVPVAATFVVVARLVSRGYRKDEDLYPGEARAAFLLFVVSALGVTRERAAELAGEYYFVTLAAELGYPRALTEMDKYRRFLPADDPMRRWEIRLHTHPTCAVNR